MECLSVPPHFSIGCNYTHIHTYRYVDAYVYTIAYCTALYCTLLTSKRDRDLARERSASSCDTSRVLRSLLRVLVCASLRSSALGLGTTTLSAATPSTPVGKDMSGSRTAVMMESMDGPRLLVRVVWRSCFGPGYSKEKGG